MSLSRHLAASPARLALFLALAISSASAQTKLGFGIVPSSVIVGSNGSSVVTVQEENGAGTVITTANGSITLTIAGPAGFATQIYTATASSGIATFNTAGTVFSSIGTYTYTATANSLTSATATEIVVPAPSTSRAPSEPVGITSPTQTATISFSSNFTLGSISVVTQGATGLDFNAAAGGTCTVGNVYTSGSTCTVNYTFTPKATGQRLGAILIYDNSTPTAVWEAIVYLSSSTGALAAFTPGIISTVAGNGSGNYNGDNIAATSAEVNAPEGVAIDAAGNLYIADYGNDRIRKVSITTGYITTVAGNGTTIYSGDGISATSASLSGPTRVALDGAGNLYIADARHQRIREVFAVTGTITTVAGTGTAGFNSDGISAISAMLNSPNDIAVDGAGNLYIADAGNQRIRFVSASTGWPARAFVPARLLV